MTILWGLFAFSPCLLLLSLSHVHCCVCGSAECPELCWHGNCPLCVPQNRPCTTAPSPPTGAAAGRPRTRWKPISWPSACSPWYSLGAAQTGRNPPSLHSPARAPQGISPLSQVAVSLECSVIQVSVSVRVSHTHSHVQVLPAAWTPSSPPLHNLLATQ